VKRNDKQHKLVDKLPGIEAVFIYSYRVGTFLRTLIDERRQAKRRSGPVIMLGLIIICGTWIRPAWSGLYRWVDENGHVHFSDQVPPRYSQIERTVYNNQAKVTAIIDAPKTRSQLEVERHQARLEEEKRMLAQKQAKRDRALLRSFISEQDIIIARDSRITTIDSSIRITEEKLIELKKKSGELEAKSEKYTKRNKPVPENIAAKLASVRDQIEHLNTILTSKIEEKTALEARFAADVKRYRELTQASEN
jgi:DNA repair exonuclease SbcCD ATPase subunit